MSYLHDHNGYAKAEILEQTGEQVVAVYRYAQPDLIDGTRLVVPVKMIEEVTGIDVTSRYLSFLTSANLVVLAEATVMTLAGSLEGVLTRNGTPVEEGA